MDKLITIFTGILIIFALMKLYSIFRAIGWIIIYGKKFKEKIKKQKKELTKKGYIKIIKKFNAKFLPWGLKEYILQDISYVKKRLKNPVFSFIFLTIVNFLSLLLISIVYELHLLSLQQFDKILFIALAIVYSFASLAMSLELILTYLIFGKNAYDFHKLTIKPNCFWSFDSRISELLLIFIKIFITIIIGSITFYVAFVFYKAINIGNADICGIDTIWGRILECLYFAASMLLSFDSGKYYPTNQWGIWVVLLYRIQSFALIGFVIGTFSSLRGKKDN